MQSDNTTVVAYVNNFGGSKSVDCNDLAKEIWLWCIGTHIWLSTVHIPGVSNVVADRKSRSFDDQIEWKLDERVFDDISSRFVSPEIDLFATRLHAQLHCLYLGIQIQMRKKWMHFP